MLKKLLFCVLLCGIATSFRITPARGTRYPRLQGGQSLCNSYRRSQHQFCKVLEVGDDVASSSASPTASMKDEVVKLFSNIIDPEEGTDVYSSGAIGDIIVSEDGSVQVKLTSTMNEELQSMCKEALRELPWVTRIAMTPNISRDVAATVSTEIAIPQGLTNVKNVIAVSSCKGGVGKSTVSVNLAYTLAQAGAKVGILDADIYGPSLPTMTKPESTDIVYASNNFLQPLEYKGVKLMSMGFINKGAAIMRGPMVNQILSQFVSLCDWGSLDYLILDMPPGTGDIQLTLAQIMNISAAVIVTTPQRLSFVDVVKGIDLFDTVNIPCVAVVENMAEYPVYTFDDDFYKSLGAKAASVSAASLAISGDPEAAADSVAKLLKETIEKRKQPRRVFGQGHTHRLRDMWGLENLVSIPVVEELSECGDAGDPYVLANPDSPVATSMANLAAQVLQEIGANSGGVSGKAGLVTSLGYNPEKNSIIVHSVGESGAESTALQPFDLRCSCRCATCIEEFTGEQLLDTSTVPKTIRPLNMAPIGRYAMSVDWSDGHKSLFPFKHIASLVKEKSHT